MTFSVHLAERLSERARAPRSPDLAIEDWRLLVDTGTSTEVGLKDNAVGGPYDAPNSVGGTRGEAYVRWADGKVSSGTVDLTSLAHLDEDLALWRQAAYADPFAAEVLGPQVVPDVPLYDPEVAQAVYAGREGLFAMLERIRTELPAYEAERVSGSATVSVSGRHLITSRGLDVRSESTAFGAYADADHRAYDVLSLRRMPTEAELTRMIRTAGEANRALKREATLAAGPRTVVFMPGVAEAMLGKYVLGNLDGSRVLNASSAFSPEQFSAHEAVFHPAFGLTVDPLTPMSPGSYGLTREGVPARVQPLIEGGRLVTPLLDLKHARKASLPPTPFPRGGSSLRFAGPTQPLEALVAGLESGLIVYQLLGLHTQDAARGQFSLTVSQGLVVENGQVLGHAKALIAGHFLGALAESFAWGSVEGKPVPALAIRADVTPG